MPVQDDVREIELIELFDLQRPENHSRGGIDAVLHLDGNEIPFEIKSTTQGSVTTVRDFGMDHIKAWEGKHWLIGFYNKAGTQLKYSCYGSPKHMKGWIEEKRNYIKTDFDIAMAVPDLINLECMYRIIGEKDVYTYEEALKLHKRQYTTQEYRSLMDLPNGYTPERMLGIFKDRCMYLLKRGSTLNNPHIPNSYFQDFEKIITNHAQKLKELVRASLKPAL